MPGLLRIETVQLVVSDAHAGLKAAIAQTLDCPWQRCTVHFLPETLGHARKDQQEMVSALLRPIFNAEAASRRASSQASARTLAHAASEGGRLSAHSLEGILSDLNKDNNHEEARELTAARPANELHHLIGLDSNRGSRHGGRRHARYGKGMM